MSGKNKRKMAETQISIENFKRDVRDNYPIDRALTDHAGVRLIGSGPQRMACCPFHEDRNPSLSVDVAKGVYKCHALSCNASGDLFELLQSVYSMDFNEALIFAADQVGIVPPTHLTLGVQARLEAVRKPRKRETILYPAEKPMQVPPKGVAPEVRPIDGDITLPRTGEWISVWDPSRKGVKRLRRFKPDMVHVYRDRAGVPFLVILRCNKPGKPGVPDAKPEKFFIPLIGDVSDEARPECHIKGSGARMSWIVSGLAGAARRPFYGLEGLPVGTDCRRILVVEGEKTADAARRLLEGIEDLVVLSPLGGGAAPLRADWSALIDILADRDGVEILVWPDADKPLLRPDGTAVDRQKKFVTGVLTAAGQAMVDSGHSPEAIGMIRITPPTDVMSGWDLDDALQAGWTGEDVMRHILENSVNVDHETLHLIPAEPPAGVAGTSGAAAQDGDEDELISMLREVDEMTAGLPATPATPVGDPDGGSESRTSIPLDDVEEGLPARYGAGWDDEDDGIQAVADNPSFRCLGYNNGVDFFYSMDSGFIYALAPALLKPNYLLKLARKAWWLREFPRVSDRGAPAVDWEAAVDALVRVSHKTGFWDPRKEVGPGACLDRDHIVFNTGSALFVDNGVMAIQDFRGENCYTRGQAVSMPDFHNPFEANEPKILKLLEIISSLDWQDARRELSIMGLFGWMCISVIGGILKWRPHLWLDGPRSSGKTWIIRNIVVPALGDYCINVTSNTSEPGIRRRLNARSLPLIFDEAEGETKADRIRMDGVLRLARYSASDSKAVILHGDAGSGGEREYSIRSSFLLTSISTQIDASADQTRFARAHLNEGRKLEQFVRTIEVPARELLTEEFSRRFIARMIMRARDYQATYSRMITALTTYNLERRIVDVYASFATGAWLLLRDGVPEDEYEAIAFIGDTFNIVAQLQDFGEDISHEKDHTRLFRVLLSASLRIESPNMGPRQETIGALIAAASGWSDNDCIVGQAEAMTILKGQGMRPALLANEKGDAFTLIREGERADCMVIHRNAEPVRAILKDTAYLRGYSQVMLQHKDVRSGAPIRFSVAIGIGRTIIVPLSIFSLGEGHEE